MTEIVPEPKVIGTIRKRVEDGTLKFDAVYKKLSDGRVMTGIAPAGGEAKTFSMIRQGDLPRFNFDWENGTVTEKPREI